MSYVTVANVRDYKDIDSAADDTLITDLISRAEDWLNRECKRTVVAEADTTRYCDAIGDHIDGLYLKVNRMGDLCAITTVTNGDSVAVSSSEYTTYPKTLTVENPVYSSIKILGSVNKYWTYTTDWENAISIVGRWGLFTSTSVPSVITQAIVRLTLYAYKVKDTDAFETVVIPDAGLIQAPSGFPVDVARIVRLLRRP